MRKHATVALLAAVYLAGCTTIPDAEDASALRFVPRMPSVPSVDVASFSIPGTNRQAPQIDPSLEPVVYWRVIEDDILVVHAQTNGCTSRSDFDVRVVQYHEDTYTVALTRTGDDLCQEDLPWGLQLGFGFEELGVPYGGQVIMLNPLDDRAWDWDEPRQLLAAR